MRLFLQQTPLAGEAPKFVQLVLEQDLLGGWLLIRESGQTGGRSQLKREQYLDRDAAMVFSDILTIPDAMGLGLSFAEGEGPRFAHPVRTAADIAKLAVPDMGSSLRYVMDAVSLIRKELDNAVPLIGFSGSPW